jgi:predicted ATPase
MFFTLIEWGGPLPPEAKGCAFLREDNWDDWGKYRTVFRLIVFDEKGDIHNAGDVKIGQKGLKPNISVSPGSRAPTLPTSFDRLPEEFFSLGQDENYYETINLLGEPLRTHVLQGLNDCALNPSLFEKIQDEEVTTESLLRSVGVESVRRFHRLARGDATLTDFNLRYQYAPSPQNTLPPPTLSFETIPGSAPPTNVHVLIGRNGVGKTTCMRNMAKALLQNANANEPTGEITIETVIDSAPATFAGLVEVSFSAFDEFIPPEIVPSGCRHVYVGLRDFNNSTPEDAPRMKSADALANDFSQALEACSLGLRAARWRSAILTLENDPLFEEASVEQLLLSTEGSLLERAKDFFKKLSSGHAIVLLTITKLVELVDERTLVLLDEPEGHLHPPLLSAFIRSLSELLIQRNGVAIVATHSPVVLQEVPRSCVWKIRRSGNESVAEAT